MKTVEELMIEAFSGTRDPRSPEYKAGVRAALDFRLNKADIGIPYPAGTAASDAFFSGLDEGHRIWRNLESEVIKGEAGHDN